MLKKILYTWICTSALCAMIHASTCNPYYPSANPPSSDYVTLTFANVAQNSGVIGLTGIYITVVGSTGTTGADKDFVLFDLGSGVGSLSPAGQTLPSQYFYQLDSLPKDSNQNPYVFVPADLPIAHLYVGVDYGVALQTLTGATWFINPPTLTNVDANIYHLYDAISFSTSPKLQFLGTDLQTSFGLPLTTYVTYNGGNTTYYLGLPPTTPRDDGTTASVFGSYNTSVEEIPNPTARGQWSNTIRSFIAAGNAGATTYLQLLEPTHLMAIDTFDPEYLFDAKYGSNWFDQMWGSTGFYSSNPLYFDVTALGTAYTTYHYVNNSPAGTLNFAADGFGGAVTVAPTGSQPFFSNSPIGPNSFHASGDATVYPALCQYLSDGFVTGIFPTAFPAGTALSSNYIQKQYVSNPTSFWGGSNASPHPTGGPWFNFYAGIFHDFAPFSSTNNYSNINPETGDVSMGFFQNIPPLSASTTATVAVVLGNMTDSVIPNFTDSTLYFIQLTPAAAGVSLVYNDTTVSFPSVQQFHDVTVPVNLIVEYAAGSYAGLTYGIQVFFSGTGPTANYQFCYPQPPTEILPALLTPITVGSTGWNIGAGIPD